MSRKWQVKENTVLKETVYQSVIGPGLNVFIMPKKGYRKKYAIFSTRFGSIDSRFTVAGDGEEISVPDGVAHFLEHKLFEDEAGNVFDRFAELGASANAFTSFTHTTYLFSCTDYFFENLKLLLDFVQHPYFTEESVAREQGIIEQEIRMYEDNPQWRLFFNLLGALYQNHPVRKDIAGTVESIRRINPDVLYKCYRTFYHPRNMAVFVVGDIDPAETLEYIEENISQRGYPPMGEIKRFYPEEPARVQQKKVTQNLVVSQPLFNLGFKDHGLEKLSGGELFRREVVTELLLDILFGQSEPLFNELYEDGLINEDFVAGYTGETSYGYTLIGGETRDPEELYRRILRELEKVKEKGIDAEVFERHRRRMMGVFIRRFNSLEFIANNYLSYYFRGIDFFAYPSLLAKITLDEVHERLTAHLRADDHAVSIIFPQS